MTKYIRFLPRVPQCTSARPNWSPYPLSRKRVCPPPLNQRRGTHSPAGEWVGASQSGRRETKSGTLLYSVLLIFSRIFIDKSLWLLKGLSEAELLQMEGTERQHVEARIRLGHVLALLFCSAWDDRAEHDVEIGLVWHLGHERRPISGVGEGLD